MQIDPKKIAVFLEVAKLGSVTLAAAKLFRTQSAVTHLIRSLEDELGVQLFNRQHRKIILTKEGLRLKDQATPLINRWHDFYNDFLQSNEESKETLKIGIRQDIESAVVPSLFQNFVSKFPNIRLEFVTANDLVLENLLADRKIDFAFIVVFQKKNRFDFAPCFQFPERIYCSIKNKQKISTMKQVLSGKIVDFESELQCFSSYCMKFYPQLEAEIVHRKADYIAANHRVSMEILKSSQAFALLPDWLGSKSKELKPVFAHQCLDVTVDLAWNKSDYLRTLEQTFIDVAKSHVNFAKL